MDSGVIFRSIRILCAVYYILCKPDFKIPLEFQWIPMEKGRTTLGRQSQIYQVLSIGKSTYDARLKYLEIDQSN
jgi:hypothetical protein